LRIDNRTLHYIKDTFKNKKIYLFGSRVDDSLKGGDIDLFIDEELSLKELRKLKVELFNKIELQKIDLISKSQANEILKNSIYKNGIVL
jgi:predicted nucleotidyltransferase